MSDLEEQSIDLDIPEAVPLPDVPSSKKLLRLSCTLQPHIYSEESFRAEERARAARNQHRAADADESSPGDTLTRLFVSHCWRKKGSAEDLEFKRLIIANLSLDPKHGGLGAPYWADFLDLQASGPLPWRKEIEEGIMLASKVVCLVDEAWLSSYNCLQELAYAVLHNKPVVVVILDQEAWDLLTVPGGAEKAWGLDTWGPPLRDYRGEEMTPGEPFDAGVTRRLFGTLSGINLCPCRPLEQSNWGLEATLSNMRAYVSKDLDYFKQHAELQAMVGKWKAGNKRQSLLLRRQEMQKWNQWLQVSKRAGVLPGPTEDMDAFVSASQSMAKSNRRKLMLLCLVLLSLIVAGAVAAIILAVQANAARAEAQENEQKAMEQTVLARMSAESAVARLIPWSLLGGAVQNLVSRSELRMYLAALSVAGMATGADVRPKLLGMLQHRMLEVNERWLEAGELLPGGDETPGTRVSSISWSSADANRLVSGGSDGSLRLYDASDEDDESGEPVATFPDVHAAAINAVAFSPADPQILATASDDATVRIWRLLADGGGGGRQRRLAAYGGPQLTPVALLEGHEGAVSCVEFSADGLLLASGATDATVIIWDPADGSLRQRLVGGHSAAVLSVSWNPSAAPDGSLSLASGDSGGAALLWAGVSPSGPLQPSRYLNVFDGEMGQSAHGGAVTGVGWLPYSDADAFSVQHLLVTASADSLTHIWTVPAAEQQQGFSILETLTHTGPVLSLDICNFGDGVTYVATGAANALIWLNAFGTDGVRVSRNVLPAHEGNPVEAIACSGPAESFLLASAASGSSRDRVSLLRGLKDPKSSDYNPEPSSGASWSSDGSLVALTSASSPGSFRIWELGKPLDEQPGRVNLSEEDSSEGGGPAIAFSPPLTDKSWLAVTDGTNVRLYDYAAKTFKPEALQGGHSIPTTSPKANVIMCIAWDPSSGALATGGADNRIAFWASPLQQDSAAEGPTLRWMAHKDSVNALSFSPAAGSSSSPGLLLASASSDSTVAVWNAATGEKLHTLVGHLMYVKALAWSPGSSDLLASGSLDGTTRIWDLKAGTSTVLRGSSSPVMSVSWAPAAPGKGNEGSTIAASSLDGSFRIWDPEEAKPKVFLDQFRDSILCSHFWPLDHNRLVTCTDGGTTVWSDLTRSIADWIPVLDGHHFGDSTLLASDLIEWKMTDAYGVLNYTDNRPQGHLGNAPGGYQQYNEANPT